MRKGNIFCGNNVVLNSDVNVVAFTLKQQTQSPVLYTAMYDF